MCCYHMKEVMTTTIIATIGRMNPPTPGHIRILNVMIKKAQQLDVSNIYVILSHTHGNADNPLSCPNKRKILLNAMSHASSSRSGVKINVICTNPNDEFPIPDAIQRLIELHGHPKIQKLKILLVSGSDRNKSYRFVSKYMAERRPPVKVEEMHIRRAPGSSSASQARHFAATRNEKAFMRHMTTRRGMTRKLAKNIYGKLVSSSPHNKDKIDKYST